MNKNQLKWIGGIVALLVVLFSQETIDVTADTSTGNSEAKVQFFEDDSPANILDPLNPTNPGPTGEGVTGNTGKLTLDYISSIDFGSHRLSLDEVTYKAHTVVPFIQVTDRRGSDHNNGWKVSVSASAFTSTTDENITLKGATINFSNGKAVSNRDNYKAPRTNNVTLTTDDTAAKVASAAPSVDGLAATEIEGRGSWVIKWLPAVATNDKNDSVTLTVPAGVATDATYRSTLTWTLSDVP